YGLGLPIAMEVTCPFVLSNGSSNRVPPGVLNGTEPSESLVAETAWRKIANPATFAVLVRSAQPTQSGEFGSPLVEMVNEPPGGMGVEVANLFATSVRPSRLNAAAGVSELV